MSIMLLEFLSFFKQKDSGSSELYMILSIYLVKPKTPFKHFLPHNANDSGHKPVVGCLPPCGKYRHIKCGTFCSGEKKYLTSKRLVLEGSEIQYGKIQTGAAFCTSAYQHYMLEILKYFLKNFC